MQIAHEMDLTSEHHRADLERLMRRIPFAVADILEVSAIYTAVHLVFNRCNHDARRAACPFEFMEQMRLQQFLNSGSCALHCTFAQLNAANDSLAMNLLVKLHSTSCNI